MENELNCPLYILFAAYRLKSIYWLMTTDKMVVHHFFVLLPPQRRLPLIIHLSNLARTNAR